MNMQVCLCAGGEEKLIANQKRSMDPVPKYSVEQTQKQKRHQTGDSSQETGSGRGAGGVGGGLKRGVYVFLITSRAIYVFLITSRAKTACSTHKF
jgi:hypothetical protein